MLSLFSEQRGLISLPSLGLLVLLAAGHGAASPTTFSDGTFANANWSATKVTDTTIGQTAFFSAGQNAGGNPGPSRMTTLDWAYDGTSASQGIRVAALDSNAVYNPAVSGAISSVSFSLDGSLENRSTQSAIGQRLVLFQSGTYYFGPEGIIPQTFDVWVTDALSGLSATDFGTLTGSNHPDFSAGGAPIEFGYSLETFSGPADASPSENAFFYGLGTDNFSVTVNAAPEPATLSLCGLAVVGLLWIRRH
jgi:hypothetical protein